MFVLYYICWSRRGCCDFVRMHSHQLHSDSSVSGSNWTHMIWRGSACSLRLMGLYYTPESAMTAQAQIFKGVKEKQHMPFELAHSLMQEIYVVTPQEHITIRQRNYEFSGKERQMCDGTQDNWGEWVQHKVILTKDTKPQWWKHDRQSVQGCSCLISTHIMWKSQHSRLKEIHI